MARKFTDEERQRLHDALLSKGRELFTRYGLKKTTIRELTEPLSIAKSSFYLFFDSKEALYWQLLLAEAPKVEAKIRSAVAAADDDIQSAVENLLRATVHEIENNPLYRRLLDHPEELQQVIHRLPEEVTQAKAQGSRELILAYVENWQADEQLLDAHPEVIAGALRAVTLLTFHKDEIGPAIYHDVMDTLITAVAAGLTRSEASS
jgi:AcrR family transcriptional regulator